MPALYLSELVIKPEPTKDNALSLQNREQVKKYVLPLLKDILERLIKRLKLGSMLERKHCLIENLHKLTNYRLKIQMQLQIKNINQVNGKPA